MWIIHTILCLIIIYLLAIYLSCSYWKKRGVPYKLYFPYIDGICALMFKKVDITGYTNNVYKNFPDSRYLGFYLFGNPTLVIKDYDLIKEMFIKNFDHFLEHQGLIDFENEPLWSNNLFNLKGKTWKEMRSILSPTFTSSQMKTMFLLIKESAEDFVDYFMNEPGEIVELELKDVFKRFTIDVIANTAFDIKINSLKDKTNDFFMYGRNINTFDGFWHVIKFVFIKWAPRLATLLDVHYINPVYSNYFSNVVKKSIEYRKKYNIVRNDMIHLLLKAKKKNDKGLTDNEIISQAFGFFTAGSDTVSTALYFTAYELASNPDCQEKLRREIEEGRLNSEVSYDLVMNLRYLNAVILESLRKNPLLFATERVCTKPYQIKPINSNEKPIDINVGDYLLIPISAYSMDPKYFPNPEKFDPDRFLDKNWKSSTPFYPFGLGPRVCIAYRFAMMEMKMFFFNLISNFEIVPTKRSPIPYTLIKGVMRTETVEDLWFGLKKRKF